MAAAGAFSAAVYNVGDYTFAPIKLVWSEIASSFCVAAIGSDALHAGTPPVPVVPDHKVYFACCQSMREADR